MWRELDPARRKQLVTFALVLQRAGVPRGPSRMIPAEACAAICLSGYEVVERVGAAVALLKDAGIFKSWAFGTIASISPKRQRITIQLYPVRYYDFKLHKPGGGITYVVAPDWDATPSHDERMDVSPCALLSHGAVRLTGGRALKPGEREVLVGHDSDRWEMRTHGYHPPTHYHGLCEWTRGNPDLDYYREPRYPHCVKCTHHVSLPWVTSPDGICTNGRIDSVPPRPDDWDGEGSETYSY